MSNSDGAVTPPRKLSVPPDYQPGPFPPSSPYRLSHSASAPLGAPIGSPTSGLASVGSTGSVGYSRESMEIANLDSPPRKSVVDRERAGLTGSGNNLYPRKLSNPPEYAEALAAAENKTIVVSPRPKTAEASPRRSASESSGVGDALDVVPASGRHDFKLFSIAKPSYCNFCKEFIWYVAYY
jgi:hypothetical protein